jgi:hypothetical protein
MKHIATYLTSATVAMGLLIASEPAWAQMEVPMIMLGMSLLSKSGSAPAPLAAPAPAATLATGRSVGQLGYFCTTPAKTCELRHASYVGIGCSCRVPGGRAKGSVTP